VKKFALRLVLLLALCSLLVSLSRISIVRASGIIYIRDDGSVEGTDKIQRDGNVYTFTNNIYDNIRVERDNIVVDGAGYILQGTGSGTGIELENRSNVTVKNLEIKAFNDGIWLLEASDNTLIGNKITTNNQWGIRLSGFSNNNVSGNTLINNGYGILVMSSDNNTISGNSIMNKHCLWKLHSKQRRGRHPP
jgi:parallel beta-helix repeat protein